MEISSHRAEEKDVLDIASSTDMGQRVFDLREERGWSQTELARRARLSRTTLSHLEAGITRTPSSPTLRRLARAFGMSVMDLLAEPGDWTGDREGDREVT